jgi:hypothetical protein
MKRRTKYIIAGTVVGTAIALSARGYATEVEVQQKGKPCEGGINTGLIAENNGMGAIRAYKQPSPNVSVNIRGYGLTISKAGNTIYFPDGAKPGQWYEGDTFPTALFYNHGELTTQVLGSRETFVPLANPVCYEAEGKPVYEKSSKER